jgi:hypothetical protein
MNYWIILFIIIVILIAVSLIPTDSDQSEYKNCLNPKGITIDVTQVPLDSACPSDTITCPQYFGCNNNNIPLCTNRNADGDYTKGCPTCKNGRWQCDFFVMGNNTDGIANPHSATEDSCAGADNISNCQFGDCQSNPHCKWGSFNSSGSYKYVGKGDFSPDKITGYKVVGSSAPIFRLNYGFDGGNHLAGIVSPINGISLQECIKRSKESYTYDDNDFDGSYGFVYDTSRLQCNLHRVGDGVGWNTGTVKYVKG